MYKYLILLILPLLNHCAAKYVPIDPHKPLTTLAVRKIDSLDYRVQSYNLNPNKQWRKRAEFYGMIMMSFDIKNNGSETVTLDYDQMNLSRAQHSEVIPSTTIEHVVKKVKLVSGKHMLWALFNIFFTKTSCQGGSCDTDVTWIPVGLPIGLLSTLVSYNSNKKFAADMHKHHTGIVEIKPGQSLKGTWFFTAMPYKEHWKDDRYKNDWIMKVPVSIGGVKYVHKLKNIRLN